MTRFPHIRIEKYYGGKPDWWVVTEDCKVEHPERPYIIPAGYITDMISAPWLSYVIVHPHGAGANEAIAHDWEHENRLFEPELGRNHARHLSNLMLAVRMIQGKAPIWKVWVMLVWVSALSWIRWKKLSTNIQK